MVVRRSHEPFEMKGPSVDEKPPTNIVRRYNARMIALTVATPHLDVKTVAAEIAE